LVFVASELVKERKEFLVSTVAHGDGGVAP
jgi:hypothetical protein